MTVDGVTFIVHSSIQTVLLTSLPIVGLGLLVGLIIAIFQAVTQIQEQTLTFVPKMIVIFLMIAATFPWMARLLMELVYSLWENIPFYAR
ncbi:flagellar biosynthesis protein FliQ [Thermoproteota archaeon]